MILVRSLKNKLIEILIWMSKDNTSTMLLRMIFVSSRPITTPNNRNSSRLEGKLERIPRILQEKRFKKKKIKNVLETY